MSTTAAPPQSSTPTPTAIPRGFAALIGLLAVGAALAFGHLVAALISPSSSPYLAVGDTVIRFSPEPLTEFAKVTFGTNDKPILLSGIAVVIAIVAALAGLASRRNPRPGLVVIVVLGVLGFAAVAIAPVFSPLDLVAPLVSIAAGVLSFRWLYSLARRAYISRTDAGGGVSRRNVLIGGSVAVGVGALAAGGGGLLLGNGVGGSRDTVTKQLQAARLVERAPAIPAGAAFPEVGTPTFLTANPDFYRIDIALRIPSQTASAWSMKIHGMVDKEITLTFADLLARPLVERTITMTCVSNPIGGNLVSTTNFIGVELRDILMEAGIQPGADQLFSTSVDGWYTGTPTDVVMEPGRGALLAIGMNGEALPPEHGFPVRMVVPGLYGYVSATKWVVDLEATTFANPQKQGYWRERSWATKAPIKTMSRIDSPQGFAKVPAGKVTVSGIAWAQHTGVEKVEVRMDGGAWQVAELATEVNINTWRMWRTDFQLGAGSHTVQVRATDKTGYTQTEARADPIPDGASGWPATIFTVN